MKLLPIPLSPLGAPPPMSMWSSDLLWRYPPAPPSPLAELRTQLPPQLLTDPRLWGREEVAIFLRWSEREFDLPKFELDLFQMNGKAICLLSKTDFAERCPAAGDVLHNVLHMLVRDAQMQHRHLPSSPITPTSRYPLSPHSQPPTPNWSALAPPENPFYTTQQLQQFMQSNSVTLSPAPSTDSQVGSPPSNSQPDSQQLLVQNNFSHTSSSTSSSGVSSSGSNGAASNNSDSDEEPSPSSKQQSPLVTVQQASAPTARNQQRETKHLPPPLVLEPKALAAWSISGPDSGTPTPSPLTPSGNSGINGVKREFFPNQNTPNTPLSAGAFIPVKREFFPDTPEPNTNGRLLWDFLQQLLNDPQQRYSNYIAWKCRDTGVFKIVDPAGLAKLWGIQKNHLSMNYDKMSRALRYYYRVNILRKVQGERHCYQFLRNPSELKSIKNISLLRQTMANQQAQQQAQQQQQANSKQNQKTTVDAPPQSPSYLMNGSIASIMTNNNFASHIQNVANAVRHQQTSPVPPSPHHLQSASPPVIKMESHCQETDDMKPTDLSTNSSSSRNNSNESSVDCYPLIRNSNGLTTIQILRHHQENGQYQPRSASVSPQPYIKPSLSPPVQQQQQQQQSHEDQMDDMPTDLSKNDSSYYK